jgi:uncharacterized protein YjbI with pentapeptide repeats
MEHRESETMLTTDVAQMYADGQRDFTHTDIRDPKDARPLRESSLNDADFTDSFIVADFSRCSLKQARFVRANIKTCRFEVADLRGADFSCAALDGATFAGAHLTGATFTGATEQGHIYAAGEFPTTTP